MNLVALFGSPHSSTNEIPTLSYTWSLKKVPFWAEPPRIDHYREYSSRTPCIRMSILLKWDFLYQKTIRFWGRLTLLKWVWTVIFYPMAPQFLLVVCLIQLQLLFYVFLLSFVFYNRDLYNSLALFLYRSLSLFNYRFSLRLYTIISFFFYVGFPIWMPLASVFASQCVKKTVPVFMGSPKTW